MTTQTDLAWLAGIIDGEGSIALTHGGNGTSPVLRLMIYNSDEAILFKCRAILDDAGISFYEWWDRRAPRAGASLSISTRGVLALTPRIRPFMVRQIDRLDAATAFFAGRYAGERQRVLWTDADRVAWSELRSEFIKGAEVLRVEH